jgi:hypothetical protein
MGLVLCSKNLRRVMPVVRPRLLPRQRQRLPMPQPGIRRQRHQRRVVSQRWRRSQLGDPRPLWTLGVTQDARPAPTPRLLRRRWRWCSGDDSGLVPSKKLRQSPSPVCCPVPTRSLVTLGQQFCGSGRRLRLSTSASATGAPNWRSAPGRHPDNSSPSGPNSSGTARSTRGTSRRCALGSWRRPRGRRR